mmetsp:Transcript_6464/g.11907  ORF Transcript_6464/g.11907 Transcript_6464/m.11907 type:complete len:317 (-) Transcript_6464:273-1223(-)
MRVATPILAAAGAIAVIVGLSTLRTTSSSAISSSLMMKTAAKAAIGARRPLVSGHMNKVSPDMGVTRLQHVGAMAANWQTSPGPLDKVYVYDHCPFCVRVRMIYGLKKIRHDLIWLQNDDKETPMSMHPKQKKVLPIVDKAGKILIESLDIVEAIDADPKYGPPLLLPASGRTDIDAWVKSTKTLMGKLSRPRYVQTYLPEFAFKSARDAFVLNHPIDKTKFSKGDQGIFQEYEEALKESDELIAAVNAKILEVENMIYSPECVSPGGLSYDDITFFARFRGFTLIKGLKMGPRLTEYLNNMSALSEIPLYTGMAV